MPYLKVRQILPFQVPDSGFGIRGTNYKSRFGYEIRASGPPKLRFGFGIRPNLPNLTNLKLRES